MPRTSKTKPRTLRLPEVPLLHKSKVVRVGAVYAPESSPSRVSHEGVCLSVSECPHNWVCIAGLGGLPWHEMTKDAGSFLDFHELKTSELRHWAVRAGLASMITALQVTRSDEDDEYPDDPAVYLFTEDEAEKAAGWAEACDSEVARLRLVSPTDEAFVEAGYWREGADRPLAFRDDALAIILAGRLGLDGVWWDDVEDVAGLSSPRGGILPDRVDEWKHRRIK